MIPKQFHLRSRIRRRLPLLCAAAVLSFAIHPARADFIINVESVNANAGDIGDTLDVTLTNTGSSAQFFGAFQFGISTSAASGITFTSATMNTSDPYVFAGDSFDSGFSQPFYSTNGQLLNASDASYSGNGDSVGVGDTVGLGHVFFSVAAGTSPGPITVTLADYPTTSLNDNSFPSNNLTFTEENGTISINGSPPAASPEPSTLTLCTIGLLTLAGGAWRRRKRSA